MARTKIPLKADLLSSWRIWKQLLESVIVDGKIRKITDDTGTVVAYLVPVDQYKLMNKVD